MKSFSQVTNKDLKDMFGVEIVPKTFIPKISPISAPPSLIETLEYQTSNLAMIRNEKAISEAIIAPVLFAVQRAFSDKITVFSGEPITTDELSGTCDFLITKGQNIEPDGGYLILVEAKKQDLLSGLPQCIAEMYATQKINNNNDDVVYGCVSTGFEWLFLKLENKIATTNPTVYTISEIDKILGIFGWIIG